MGRPVDPLTLDTFCEAADALTAEVMKSHASSTQSLVRQALQKGAAVELRFNPRTESASMVLVFPNGKTISLIAAQAGVDENDEGEYWRA
jgi:hypothetical protein